MKNMSLRKKVVSVLFLFVISNAQVPAPWDTAHIWYAPSGQGNGGVTYNQARDSYTITANGRLYYAPTTNTNNCFMVHREIVGDADMYCRVSSLWNKDVFAGLMFPDVLTGTPDHFQASILLDTSSYDKSFVAALLSHGRGSTQNSITKLLNSPGSHFHLRRSNNMFEGYVSSDGKTWRWVGRTGDTSLPEKIFGGMVVGNAQVTAEIDKVRVADRKMLLRIMPSGDSITKGGMEQCCYRKFLWDLLMTDGLGYDADFVGSLTDMHRDDGATCERTFDPDHEGHFNQTIAKVKTTLEASIARTKPMSCCSTGDRTTAPTAPMPLAHS